MTSTRRALLLVVVVGACGEHRGGANERCREGFACDRGLRCVDGETCSDPAGDLNAHLPDVCAQYFAKAERMATCAMLPADQRLTMKSMLEKERADFPSMFANAPTRDAESYCLAGLTKRGG